MSETQQNRKPKRSDIADEMIFQCIRDRQAGLHRMFPDEVLADRFPQKVVLAKIQQMVDRGKLGYGVSLRSSWIGTPLYPITQGTK